MPLILQELNSLENEIGVISAVANALTSLIPQNHALIARSAGGTTLENVGRRQEGVIGVEIWDITFVTVLNPPERVGSLLDHRQRLLSPQPLRRHPLESQLQ